MEVVFVKAVKCLSFATLTLPLGGCALGVGLIFAGLLRAEAYAPEMTGSLFGRAMTGFALVESFMFIIVGVLALNYVY